MGAVHAVSSSSFITAAFGNPIAWVAPGAYRAIVPDSPSVCKPAKRVQDHICIRICILMKNKNKFHARPILRKKVLIPGISAMHKAGEYR
ncbi:MAG: hypothetical protein VB104_09140 [Candidatus Limiplasma sp.]|nr:hypothetical protein [Candidatus Limiplasma sp.]